MDTPHPSPLPEKPTLQERIAANRCPSLEEALKELEVSLQKSREVRVAISRLLEQLERISV